MSRRSTSPPSPAASPCASSFSAWVPRSSNSGCVRVRREPQQLLSIFTDLEDENLGLIQKCQETEDAAEAVRKRTGEAKSKLNELVGNFESDISRLQAQIAKERRRTLN